VDSGPAAELSLALTQATIPLSISTAAIPPFLVSSPASIHVAVQIAVQIAVKIRPPSPDEEEEEDEALEGEATLSLPQPSTRCL
jgi:hypothetical protein